MGLLIPALVLLFLAVFGGTVAYSLKGSKGIARLEFSASDYFLFFFLTVCALLAGMGAASLVEGSAYARTDLAVFAPTVILQVFAVCAVFIFGRYAEKTKIDFFKSLRWSDVLCGIKLFPPTIIAASLAMFLSYKAIFWFTGNEPVQQDVIGIFMSITDPAAYVLAVVSIVVLAPVSEELFFRGLLYRVLRDGLFGKSAFAGRGGVPKKLAGAVSALATSLVFAYIHLNGYAFFPLAVTGILFTACYAKSGSIVSAIVLHSLFNAANLLALIVASVYGNV